jgi:hypothetical protein
VKIAYLTDPGGRVMVSAVHGSLTLGLTLHLLFTLCPFSDCNSPSITPIPLLVVGTKSADCSYRASSFLELNFPASQLTTCFSFLSSRLSRPSSSPQQHTRRPHAFVYFSFVSLFCSFLLFSLPRPCFSLVYIPHSEPFTGVALLRRVAPRAGSKRSGGGWWSFEERPHL